MHELENVRENHATMKRHFAYLGITEVIEVSDSYDDMIKAFMYIDGRCIDAALSGGQTKLLVYVFAASHGIMYNGATMTQIVFNEVEISRRYYNLQFRL